MQKIFYGFILLLFVVSAPGCGHNKKSKEAKNPNHKPRPEAPLLKSIKKYGISSRFGTDTLLQVETFDDKGFKVRLEKYDPQGNMEYTVNYTNNEDGLPVKAVTKYADGSQDTEEHTYNSDGKVVATDWKRGDGTSGRHEYKFDDEGNMIQWDWFQGGKFVISRLYPASYNSFGLMERSFYKETQNNRDTMLMDEHRYFYDSAQRLTRKIEMENDVPLRLEEYIYDTTGNKIMEMHYSQNPDKPGSLTLTHKQINLYNEYGELVQYSKAEGQGDLELTVRNTYNNYGHLVETVYEYAHGFYRKERIVYEYQK